MIFEELDLPMATASPDPGRAGNRAIRRPCLQTADADGDGLVTRDETAGPEADGAGPKRAEKYIDHGCWKPHDTDGDGAVSEALRKWPRNVARPARTSGANADGRCAMFERLDADGRWFDFDARGICRSRRALWPWQERRRRMTLVWPYPAADQCDLTGGATDVTPLPPPGWKVAGHNTTHGCALDADDCHAVG